MNEQLGCSFYFRMRQLARVINLNPGCSTLKNQLCFFAEAMQADLKLRFKEQPFHVKEAFCNGLHSSKSNFRGIEPYVKNLYMEGKYPGTNIHRCVCPECKDDRLGKTGRNIRINNVSLPETSQFTRNTRRVKERREIIYRQILITIRPLVKVNGFIRNKNHTFLRINDGHKL